MVAAVFGRESELGAVDALLGSGRNGFAALVLEGDPGIGKTTVWRRGIARAEDLGHRVLSCRAAQAEARLSFTALGDLLAPIEAAAFRALPDPQRRAIDAALLRSAFDGAAPGSRAIGTGLVSLLGGLAAGGPVLIAIDDLQWLDRPSARALDFALRRLATHPIAVLATVRLGERDGERDPFSADLNERIRRTRLGPLSLGALYRIVDERFGHGLPRPLLSRIDRAAGGNPFYVLEIVRELEARGRTTPGPELPIPNDLRDLVAERLRRLPGRTREALLRTSALAQPTTSMVDAGSLEPAEEAGVIRIRPGGRIEFAHPLFAGAVYASASRERRRELHGELAKVASDVEERARHLMLGRDSEETDAHVADVLQEAAEHALRRGALEVAAELGEQSANHTPPEESGTRWFRQLRAARHHVKAGDPGRSRSLCEELLGASPPPSLRARALHLLAEISAVEQPEAAVPLLEEALACVGDDAGQAAEIEIGLGVVFSSGLDLARGNRHLDRAVALAERAGETALLAEAIAFKECTRLLCGQGMDEPELIRALSLEDLDREVSFQMRASLNAAQAYEFVGRFDAAHDLLLGLRERLAARGEESDLPWVLTHLGMTFVAAGDLEAAERETSEAERLGALNKLELFRAFALIVRAMIRAVRGDAAGARADATEGLAVSERIGWRNGVNQARWGLGLLSLSESDPETAAVTLDPVVTGIEAIGVYEWPIAMSLPDAIEAFVATGGIERATRLTDRLSAWGRQFDRPWALATSGRCRALVAAAVGDLDGAAAAAAQALVEHERLPMGFERARTLLVHGQVQRRRGERRAARESFRRALEIFESMGATPWVTRAAGEIARIGVRRAPAELTEGEERVAALAARGLSNPEIAARLFMSRRTVESNLARAYGKFGIRSRAELGATMAKRRPPAGS